MRPSKLRKISDIMLSLLTVLTVVSMTWLGLGVSRRADNAVSADAELFSMPEIPDDAFVIVVDAGHGGFDGGAVGTETGVIEAELNLGVAKLLSDALLADGFYVIMTRENESALADTKSEDMDVRRRIMQLDCVDLVISVHMNKYKDRTVSGPMVFYMKNSAEGKALAESVIKQMCEADGRRQRQANPEDLFVLRTPKAPSILVECGFLSNAEDEAKLCDESYRKLLADAIAEGVRLYVEESSFSRYDPLPSG